MSGEHRIKSMAGEKLRRTLTAPIFNRTIKKEVGLGQLDYEVYLHTRELYALQTAPEELVVPDELMFQIVHQTQELWLKCVAFEAANLVDALDGDSAFVASAVLARMTAITHSLRRDIEVLFTLTPEAFQVIRRSLGNGSGLESPGYNGVLLAAEAVSEAFVRWRVRRGGATLLAVYEVPADWPDVHRIAEQLCDWDGAFQGWLMAHFLLVRRSIGVDRTVRALDGFPTQALPARMTRPLFPEIWDLRVEMTRGWERDGGHAPGAARPAPVPPTERCPGRAGAGGDSE